MLLLSARHFGRIARLSSMFIIGMMFTALACGQGATTPPKKVAPPTPTSAAGDYRVVTEADGLSCRFSQDIATSMGIEMNDLHDEVYLNPGPPKPGVTMWSKANHFICKDKSGTEKEIGLINKVPNLSVDFDHKNKRVVIKTRDFGTVYRDEDNRALEMTESQISKLKTFLGL